MTAKKKVRKSSATRKKSAQTKNAIQRKLAKKKTAKKKPAKKKPAKKKPAKKKTLGGSKSRQSQSGRTSPAPTGSLGRPKVTGEEKLFLLFKQDYHARQVFSFLGVDTVKELEQYGPDQIIKLLSQPIRQAVQQIRSKLAENNRSLDGDKEFTLRFKERAKG